MIGVAKGGLGLAQKLKNVKEIVYGGWGQYVPDGGHCIWKEREAGASLVHRSRKEANVVCGGSNEDGNEAGEVLQEIG